MLFAMSINSYQILPEWMAEILAHALPWFELALGLLLITGWQLRWTATASVALLVIFSAAMLDARYKNLDIDCGCFGFGEKLTPMRLAGEGALLALALSLAVGAFLMHRRKT